jgi:hypothetical protein
MFARNMTLKLQPNRLMRFIETYNATAFPFSRSKKFRGEVAIVLPLGEGVVAASYWHSREDANSGYKEILAILASMIEDRPRIMESEVISSTLHNLTSMP